MGDTDLTLRYRVNKRSKKYKSEEWVMVHWKSTKKRITATRILGIWELFFLTVCIYLFICFLGPHPWHMGVPRLGVQLELQLLAYATVTTTQDLSSICNLHHSTLMAALGRIPNPLSKPQDWTCILMDTSQVCYCWATTGTPWPMWIWLILFLIKYHFYLYITFLFVPYDFSLSFYCISC